MTDYFSDLSLSDFRTRDWKMNIVIPEESKIDFFNSILSGITSMEISGEKTNILLCGQPKSGSLYITQLLALSLGLNNFQTGFNMGGGDYYYPRLLSLKFAQENTISHCHNTASENTIKLIRQLNLKPLILTRNLLDTIISRKDMLLKDLEENRTGTILCPSAIDRFVNGTDEYQNDLILDIFVPEYINFYVGWNLYREDKTVNPIFITYEEMIENQVELVSKVAKALKLDEIPERTTQAIQAIQNLGGINLNKGVSGRGKKAFTREQIKKLKRLAFALGCYEETYLGFELD